MTTNLLALLPEETALIAPPDRQTPGEDKQPDRMFPIAWLNRGSQYEVLLAKSTSEKVLIASTTD